MCLQLQQAGMADCKWLCSHGGRVALHTFTTVSTAHADLNQDDRKAVGEGNVAKHACTSQMGLHTRPQRAARSMRQCREDRAHASKAGPAAQMQVSVQHLA